MSTVGCCSCQHAACACEANDCTRTRSHKQNRNTILYSTSWDGWTKSHWSFVANLLIGVLLDCQQTTAGVKYGFVSWVPQVLRLRIKHRERYHEKSRKTRSQNRARLPLTSFGFFVGKFKDTVFDAPNAHPKMELFNRKDDEYRCGGYRQHGSNPAQSPSSVTILQGISSNLL